MKFEIFEAVVMAEASPSVWRAWIEIERQFVEVPAESRRPPYGGRGLKFVADEEVDAAHAVALRMEGVD